MSSQVAAAKRAQATALRAQADALDAEANAIESATDSPTSDELVPFPFGLEARAARALIQRGWLRAARIGRRWYAKRSDLVALVDRMQPMSKADDADEYVRIVDQVRKGRRQ